MRERKAFFPIVMSCFIFMSSKGVSHDYPDIFFFLFFVMKYIYKKHLVLKHYCFKI